MSHRRMRCIIYEHKYIPVINQTSDSAWFFFILIFPLFSWLVIFYDGMLIVNPCDHQRVDRIDIDR